MSFGFSIGDFISVGTLIADISRSLSESGGAKSEYQELARELDSLQQALVHLDSLQPRDSSSANIDSIKYTALSCRRPLEHFLAKIKKYDKSLGTWSKESRLKSTVNKLGWAYGQKDEIRKLQSYLNIHVGTINILLAEHGLEMMNIASQKAETDHTQIRERLDDTRSILSWIKGNVSAQSLAVKLTNSMLSTLFDMITGELRTSLKSLEAIVAKVCVSTQQIYGMVIDIQSSRALGDARWTFFQAPLIVEDALGRKFPVPSEYDYTLLESIIKYRFFDGPGSMNVRAGNFELFKTKDSKYVLSSNTLLLPGTGVTMAILVSKPELTDHICPMPLCRSSQSTEALGGGRLCCQCNVWFDKSTKTRTILQDNLDATTPQCTVSKPGKQKLDHDPDSGPTPHKRLKPTDAEDDFHLLKNVKWTMEATIVESVSKSSPPRIPKNDTTSSESTVGVSQDDRLNALLAKRAEFEAAQAEIQAEIVSLLPSTSTTRTHHRNPPHKQHLDSTNIPPESGTTLAGGHRSKTTCRIMGLDDADDSEDDDQAQRQFRSDYEYFQSLSSPGTPALGKRQGKLFINLSAAMEESDDDESF
ncbi:uncharacterized protein PAC_19191 [Phialocephala subalpina]|uniref:Ubiquitin-like domain-containing protein n=1 Tax=Phialocephala subalpina TaxID=576137 RepID=A0A1L7XW72_9HELO|nr:uncharacterized protein PAC_19191 [Phialocephala subalpina]